MLKTFAEFIIGLKRDEVVEAAGKIYSTSSLNRLDGERRVEAIDLRSLSGLVDYIKSNFDHERELMVHVVSPTNVVVFDALNDDHDRREYLSTTAMLPRIKFESFLSRESFNIMLQSCFVQDGSRDLVLKFIGTLVEDNSITQMDDGFTQAAVVKSGIATVDKVEMPNPVSLKPFRTFVEINQPASEFVLRLSEGMGVGLFEADGGAWEINAMHSIKEYLDKELEDLVSTKKVIIIA